VGIELPPSLDALTQQVNSFPSLVLSEGASPLLAITQSYSVVPTFPETFRKQLSRQSGGLERLVDRYNELMDEADRIAYITTHIDQFFLDPFDVPKLAEESVELKSSIGVVEERIDECVREGIGCTDELPPMHSGQVYPGRR
jgi:hypothetical protein